MILTHHICTSPDFKGFTGEVNTLPSLTVPNMALSVEEIERRYVRGQPVPQLNARYTGDDLHPDFDSMDPEEVRQYAITLDEQLTDIRQRRSKSSQPSPTPSTPPLQDSEHPDPEM